MDPTVLQQTPLQPSPGIGDGSKSERTPLALRVFGALLMAGGVAVVPEVIHTLAQMGTVFVEKTYTDDSLLTIILYVTLALSACFCALASGVLGFRLLRGNRRRARLIAEAVAIGLVVAFSADLLLFGVNPGLWFLGACALILIAAHVWVDPSLSDERELQRRLRLMQTREEAEDGTLGLDKTGRGYIELDFFNLFWIFVIASVAGVVKGMNGRPGELRGAFSSSQTLGTLYANTQSGVFGYLQDPEAVTGTPVPVAQEAEVHTGQATILSNVSGTQVEEYTVEILKVYDDSRDTRDLMLRVTDPRLLEQTGGIVQGMSGSPILQDGKLVGAVTHVLVDHADRGYGILAQNMLDQAQQAQTT